MRAPGLILAATLLGCGGMTESGNQRARIVLDLTALLGGRQGDYRTVAERADLTITSGGEVQEQSLQLDPGEFDPVFDVEVNTGSVTFAVDIVSTNGTLLYQGSTTATIEDDGFQVTIVPVAVSAVLVVAPRSPQFVLTDDPEFPYFTASIRVRNPGVGDLVWRVDSTVPLPQGVEIGCELPQRDASCLVNQAWTPGTDELVTLRFFRTRVLPTTGVPFISNVGNLTVPTQ